MARPVAIETPEEFERLAMGYIQWVKDNPVMKTITAAFQGEISYRKVPHARPMTQYGLASHMGIGLLTLKDYGAKPEFSAIYRHISSIMTAHNIDGASSGDMNGAIIARIEGLADKQDHTSSDGSMTPQQMDMSKLTDEQLKAFDTLISQASEAGAFKKESD